LSAVSPRDEGLFWAKAAEAMRAKTVIWICPPIYNPSTSSHILAVEIRADKRRSEKNHLLGTC
jgi:hypothetical protein